MDLIWPGYRPWMLSPYVSQWREDMVAIIAWRSAVEPGALFCAPSAADSASASYSGVTPTTMEEVVGLQEILTMGPASRERNNLS